MPPWHADPAFGTFANDAHLTDREIRILALGARWLPRGGAASTLRRPRPARRAGRSPGPTSWSRCQRPFRVPAEGIVDYQ